MATLRFTSLLSDKDKLHLKLRKLPEPLEERVVELGILYYEIKDTAEGYWYYEHPRNRAALGNLRRVFKSFGYKVQVEVVDSHGQDADALLLPAEIPTLQKEYAALFGGDVVQQMRGQMVDLADELIPKHHPHLANAAILYVIEDFQPEEMADRFGRAGDVWAFAKKLGGDFAKLTGYDFQITACKTVWDAISLKSKKALMDHELCHLARTERGKWYLEDHDIQEFSEIISRYPGWAEAPNKIVNALLASEEEAAEEEAEDEAADAPIRKRKNSKKHSSETGAYVRPRRSDLSAENAPTRLEFLMPRGFLPRKEWT